MAEFSFDQMIESAKEAGGTGDAPPPGVYTAVVVTANSKKSARAGKHQVGLKFRVEGGPHDGAGLWSNQTLSPESPVALDIWFRTFEALGIPRNWWGQYGQHLEQACAAAAEQVKGARVQITVKMGDPYNGVQKEEVGRIAKLAGAPAVAPAAAVPGLPAAVPPAAPVNAVAPPVAVPMPQPTF